MADDHRHHLAGSSGVSIFQTVLSTYWTSTVPEEIKHLANRLDSPSSSGRQIANTTASPHHPQLDRHNLKTFPRRSLFAEPSRERQATM